MARDLTTDEQSAIYRNIERIDLEATERQERPHAILLGGQPGSGKTSLAGAAMTEFAERGRAVVIDADRMREHHPDYRALAESDPEHAADILHPVAAAWSRQLTDAAIAGQRNVIVDGTMRSPDDISRVAQQLKLGGYTVEARVMAVSPDVSMAHARLRYESLAELGVPARVVGQAQHDEAYQGLPHSLERLEADRLIGKIAIYDEYRRPVYENEIERGNWKAPAEAAATLQAVRARDKTFDEHQAYVDALELIATSTQARLERTPNAGPADQAVWAQRSDAARAERDELTQSRTYARAQAFDAPPSVNTLARFPELDGAYKQLANLREHEPVDASPAQRAEHEQRYQKTVSRLSEDLHRGQVPQADVTHDESLRVIHQTLRANDLTARMPDAEHVTHGEVLGSSTHHTLVKVSDQVAIVYPRAGLDRAVEPGEQIAIEQTQPGRHRVMSQEDGHALIEARAQEQGMDRSR